MTEIIDEREDTTIAEEAGVACEVFSDEPVANETALPGPAPIDTPLPWIGALRHPRLGPMVVLDHGGDFVALFTAGDLLRGCRFLWRSLQE